LPDETKAGNQKADSTGEKKREIKQKNSSVEQRPVKKMIMNKFTTL